MSPNASARLFEAKYPGISCGSSAPARNGFSSASPRSRQPHQRGRRRQQHRSRALSRLEEERLARALSSRRCREIFPRRSVRSRRDVRDLLRLARSAIGYNTDLVKPEDAPKSYADLLDPKWQGKIVKGHPGYSGAIMTATFVLARDLGWPYLEKLAQQKVMQVQSAADPPKKILLGERAIMADGNDYNLVLLKDQGKPVESVYATEGSPLIIVPCGVFQSAPNPNAARLFQSFFFSAETQQMLVDEFRPSLVPRAGQGEARPRAAVGAEIAQGRSRRGAGAERGDQGALFQAVWGVTGSK
jgi:ABC-type Fe3+ transport system substrate-binding protein